VEPTEAINLVEVGLRDLVRLVLGDEWEVKGRLDISKLEEVREVERKRRDGAVVPTDLLDYTHLYQLREIIKRNWAEFKPALHDRARFDVYMDRLEDFRNAPMHSRQLLPFERDLLAGMAGEIRNEVTVYRTTRGPDMEYYPKIEQVTDSFGNNPNAVMDVDIKARLKVGDTVKFDCRGWDPQDRNLIWEMTRGGVGGNEILARGEGSEVILGLVITDEMVQERLVVGIAMKSDGRYHRRRYWDDSCEFYYGVDPPTE
jgi:hypothetical protein